MARSSPGGPMLPGLGDAEARQKMLDLAEALGQAVDALKGLGAAATETARAEKEAAAEKKKAPKPPPWEQHYRHMGPTSVGGFLGGLPGGAATQSGLGLAGSAASTATRALDTVSKAVAVMGDQ